MVASRLFGLALVVFETAELIGDNFLLHEASEGPSLASGDSKSARQSIALREILSSSWCPEGCGLRGALNRGAGVVHFGGGRWPLGPASFVAFQRQHFRALVPAVVGQVLSEKRVLLSASFFQRPKSTPLPSNLLGRALVVSETAEPGGAGLLLSAASVRLFLGLRSPGAARKRLVLRAGGSPGGGLEGRWLRGTASGGAVVVHAGRRLGPASSRSKPLRAFGQAPSRKINSQAAQPRPSSRTADALSTGSGRISGVAVLQLGW